jgi:hypothetical protein
MKRMSLAQNEQIQIDFETNSAGAVATAAARRSSIKHYKKLKKKIFQRMDSGPIQLFLAILLLLSLFLPDAWILGNAPYDQDAVLYIILIIILILFTLETLILSLVQDNYFLSFFFWMDTIGTLSLILDIGWISNQFLPDNGARSKGSLLRAARAAKLGARYGRLMRLLKFMKFKRYLGFKEEETEPEPEPTLSAVRKVSAALSSVLSRRVAALVLLIVIVVPFLSYELVDYSPNAWAESLHLSAINPNITSSDLNTLTSHFRSFYRHKDISLMLLRYESPYHDPVSYRYAMPYRVREDNVYHVKVPYYFDTSTGTPNRDSPTSVKYHIHVQMNVTPVAQWNAFFGIILIILVIVVLIGFSASFQSSVDELVVIPLEKMMNTLRQSATSLLRGMKAFSREEEERMRRQGGGEGGAGTGFGDGRSRGDSSGSGTGGGSEIDDEELETAVLEKMVEKLARIVKHITHDGEPLITSDGTNGVDSATASWLNQTYATGNEIKRIPTTTTDETKDELLLNGTLTSTLSGKVDIALVNSWDYDVLLYGPGPGVVPPTTSGGGGGFSDGSHTPTRYHRSGSTTGGAAGTSCYDELFHTALYMLEVSSHSVHEFQIPSTTLLSFLSELSHRYLRHNPYHNFYHAVDVMHTTYRLLSLSHLHTVFTGLEVYAMLIAAVSHDLGHLGVNNAFLVKTKSEIAMAHNDKSPLENMHCSELYQMLRRPEWNIMKTLTEGQWREARKIILFMILGTDMAHHFEQVSKTQVRGDH